MKKIMILISICCFILFSCVSCSLNTPEKTVAQYFKSLNQLDFEQAAKLLGNGHIYDELIGKIKNSGSYFENEINNNFAGFIYSHVQCEIVSVSKSGTSCEVKAKITAYNINDVLETQQDMLNTYTASSEYIDLNTGERYIRLCDHIDVIYKDMAKDIQPVVTEVTIDLVKQNDQWTIVPEKELFTALAGGVENTP